MSPSSSLSKVSFFLTQLSVDLTDDSLSVSRYTAQFFFFCSSSHKFF